MWSFRRSVDALLTLKYVYEECLILRFLDRYHKRTFDINSDEFERLHEFLVKPNKRVYESEIFTLKPEDRLDDYQLLYNLPDHIGIFCLTGYSMTRIRNFLEHGCLLYKTLSATEEVQKDTALEIASEVMNLAVDGIYNDEKGKLWQFLHRLFDDHDLKLRYSREIDPLIFKQSVKRFFGESCYYNLYRRNLKELLMQCNFTDYSDLIKEQERQIANALFNRAENTWHRIVWLYFHDRERKFTFQ